MAYSLTLTSASENKWNETLEYGMATRRQGENELSLNLNWFIMTITVQQTNVNLFLHTYRANKIINKDLSLMRR